MLHFSMCAVRIYMSLDCHLDISLVEKYGVINKYLLY